MKISIVVCTRNRSRSLQRALGHYARWRQRQDWELVIVNNASTDDTDKVISEADLPQIRTIFEPRVGSGAARERGWRFAVGDIIVFTDDDCYPDADLLDAYIAIFKARPEMSYAGGRILLWDESDIRLTTDYREHFERIPPYVFIPAGLLQSANLAFRRQVLMSIGGVDQNLGAGTQFPCEDTDLHARAAHSGKVGCFDPRPVVFHHHGRKEADWKATMRGYDQGRGAYYAKFILRKDTRSMYLNAWYCSVIENCKMCVNEKTMSPLMSSCREFLFGIKYLFVVAKWH